MNNDLIERYLYAATRRLPRKQREDVARELRGLVDDMLCERCGDRTPEEKDIRIVLTELGSPQELYAKYDEDAQKCLIGQPYYGTYVFVLKIVLACAAFGLTVSAGILQLLEPQAWYGAVAQWLAMLWQGLLSAFAFVTVLFSVFYRKGIKISEPFNFDDLPPVPQKKQEISKWECIAGIALSVLFTVVFLAVPQIFCVLITEDGGLLPIIDIHAARGTWYIILLFAACGIGREVVKLMEGRYNQKVLAVTLAVDGISALLAIWWLLGFDLINPDFLASMPVVFTGSREFALWIFTNFQRLFLGVMLLALGIDAVETSVRTLRKP